MNQFDLVHLDNLTKVNSVLAVLGFDTNKAIHVYCAQHRTMANEVKVGYLFSGELNLSREHIKGKYSRPEDVMIAASMQDRSLFEELHAMSTTCTAYGGDMALSDGLPKKPPAEERFASKNGLEYYNEYAAEEERLTKEIQQLEDILFSIRGDQFNPDGSVKTAEDYANPKEAGPKRLRRKSVKKQQTQGE